MYNHGKILKNLHSRGTTVEFGDDGGAGQFYYGKHLFTFQYSFGGGWEHVSVSLPNRCPTWEEMCRFKDIFWKDDEVVMQLHPSKNDYINNHSYCLHLWRPVNETIPTPPKAFV